MQTKNVVSNNLKEWAIAIEVAVKEGYSVVEESVDFHAGYFKALTQKEYKPEDGKVVLNGEDITSRMALTVLNSADALEMLDNPGEPNEKLKGILELDTPETTVVFVSGKQLEDLAEIKQVEDKLLEIAEEVKIQVAQKPKRRK